MPDVAVIADELTGAADCGIAFASAGLPTFVALGDAPAPATAQVVSVDTDSRRRGADEAFERARIAALRMLKAGAGTLYRKQDSTLRGHVGAEIAATLRVTAETQLTRPLALLAPAFPGTGRTMRDGVVLVGGVPLEQSEIWRDARMGGPSEPVAMLRQAGLIAAVIRLPTVRHGGEALQGELERVAASEVDAVVCDADTDDDLAAIAAAGARLSRPVIWAGSAGLARHLPAALGLRPDRARAPVAVPRRRGGVAVVVGSRSSVSREQAAALASEPGIARVLLEPRVLLAGEGDPVWPAAEVERALGAGRDLLVVFGEDPVAVERGPELAAAAGRLLAPHAGRIAGIVVTGGDVARALLAAVGATGLHLVGEVEPGVPLGVTDSTPPLPVVTKAGAFGTPATLARCRDALRRLSARG